MAEKAAGSSVQVTWPLLTFASTVRSSWRFTVSPNPATPPKRWIAIG